MSKEVRSGKIEKLWPFLARMYKEMPELFESGNAIRREVAKRWPQLNNEQYCPNCSASMVQYVHKLDFINALLLKQMGDIVRERVQSGVPFEQANQIHVVSQEQLNDAARHRTTQCRMLGLIAKVKDSNGKHNTRKGWCITKRGFAALRGEPVPAEVVVFRNEIEERPEQKVTLTHALRDHQSARNHASKQHLVADYDPQSWVHIGGYKQGEML